MLDPTPWVTVEPPIHMNGGSFQRTTSDRSADYGPGRVFFPRYGYAQWESEYEPKSEILGTENL